MNRHNVNRSIKKLIELGVVLEGVKIGVSRSYRLNPNFGWKGSAKGHREALHEHLKIVGQPVGELASWTSLRPTGCIGVLTTLCAKPFAAINHNP